MNLFTLELCKVASVTFWASTFLLVNEEQWHLIELWRWVEMITLKIFCKPQSSIIIIINLWILSA